MAGDLKLAYAQFEELETFSRFGARLDEDTRKTIEHGRRIRACLKQPEFAPVSVPAQIAVLLALTAELFDPVPLDQMTDAEQALREAAANIPAEVRERLDTAEKLSDEDRETIIEIARKSLARFQPKPEAKPEAKAEPKPEPESKPEVQRRPSPNLSPRRSHERHHGEPAPKNHQCRRSPIRRPHDEGRGRFQHRTIREIGRALADYYRTVELGLGACFRESGPAPALQNGKDEPIAGAIRRRRVRFRPGTGGPI